MYIVKRLYGQTIIVVTAVGPYNGDSLFQMSGEVATLTESMAGRVVRINDMTHAHMGLMDLVNMLAFDVRGWAGTGSDPRVINLTVASDPIQQIGVQVADLMLGRRRSPIFLSLSEALAYARRQVERQSEDRAQLN